MNLKHHKSRFSNQGFTIVELMIALSVLSVILVVGSVIMIQIGRWYTKGVSAATVQNATRNLSNELATSIQFGAKQVASDHDGGTNVYSYCIGRTRYSFLLDRELGFDSGATPMPVTTNHVLWRDTILTGSTNCAALDITTAGMPADAATDPDPALRGSELMAPHMRLTSLNISPDPSVGDNAYDISVSTAFGDSDLLNPAHTNCLGDTGGQFCATSQLTTTVIRRAK